MKVVINACFGGFGLSALAEQWLYERGYRGKGFITKPKDYFQKRPPGWKHGDPYTWVYDKEAHTKALAEFKAGEDRFGSNTFSSDLKYVLHARDIPRDEPLLIKCVETLGSASFGRFSNLKVVKVPTKVKWEISEYDGREHVSEKHKVWA